ncbi:MAG: zinc ribbon domain-containing protein [Candidatus Heimdallarchaeota archaeon]|nr:zinc ribbon domain-containing protein [Candidatus Heimdallarchaeota archaeon]
MIIYIVLIIVIVILYYYFKEKKPVSYGKESVTEKGETVKSKKEKIVADYLHNKGIRYEYEREINIRGEKVICDYYLPEFDIYVEYWGLDKLQNEDGEKYRVRKQEKIEFYMKHKLKLISLSEDDLDDIDTHFTSQLKELSKGGSKVANLLFGKASTFCTECGKKPSDCTCATFCEQCGKPSDSCECTVSVFCVKCGKELPSDSEFCLHCGEKL